MCFGVSSLGQSYLIRAHKCICCVVLCFCETNSCAMQWSAFHLIHMLFGLLGSKKQNGSYEPVVFGVHDIMHPPCCQESAMIVRMHSRPFLG